MGIMDDPIKLIYKFKNNNNRIQYHLFIFIGFIIDDKIKKILNKIKEMDFYQVLTELSKDDYKELIKFYGNKWIFKFFIKDHINHNINLIINSPEKQNKIIDLHSKT